MVKRRSRSEAVDARTMVRKLGARCDKCPLSAQSPVLGEGPLGAQMAVVGESPGREETKLGRPFVGKSGEALDAYLMKVDLPRSAVFVTNAVACFPPGGDYDVFVTLAKREWKKTHGDKVPFPDPMDCCRHRLYNELRIDKCKTCGRYLGSVPDAFQCTCQKPLHIARHGPKVIVPMGNAAMESLLGFEGITKWRGSCLKRGR